ncbi:hypothetical protein [Ostreiculturibacter nitratireducens]|uniref:hypothetical protein n=1 Tax=Ostreiculturibacter nitratireducens TaxID=3075226 RepID=UPI0031B5761E
MRAGVRIPSLPALSILATLAGFLLLQIVSLISTRGVFEYPLDDVYIHLSMAEQIAKGGYGINTGEYASAASSPLYPYLLTPFAGTEAQRFLPLLWNTFALILAAWIWGRTLELSGHALDDRPSWPGLVLAALGLLAVNAPSLAFMGMEHTLHLAASLAILMGLVRFVTEGQIGPALVVGVFLSPALRLEGLAFALSAAGVVFFLGHRRAGILLGFLALIPAVVFSAYLVSIGLSPVSNSIEAKLGLQIQTDADAVTRVLAWIRINLAEVPGQILLALSVLAFIVAPLVGRGERYGAGLRLIAYALALSGLAQLAGGRVGWPFRYEVYILATLALGIAAIIGLSETRAFPRILAGAALALLLVASGGFYGDQAARNGRWAPLAIHLQQAQMARFAQDYVGGPVAVNDIGRVSWGNPDYVLDLFGLASDEALEMGFSGTDPRWAGTLASGAGVRFAMIYDKWFGDVVGEDWVRLGKLELMNRRGILGDWEVSFYATEPVLVPELTAALHAFVPTLPDGVVFHFEGEA